MKLFQGEYCCILEICCGGQNKRDAKKTLAATLVEDLALSQTDADRVADFVLTNFDLAPNGTLKAYRDAVAKMARAYPYQE